MHFQDHLFFFFLYPLPLLAPLYFLYSFSFFKYEIENLHFFIKFLLQNLSDNIQFVVKVTVSRRNLLNIYKIFKEIEKQKYVLQLLEDTSEALESFISNTLGIKTLLGLKSEELCELP